ncbi:hypothetical protein EO98_01515 [Methanosarcina sp. 2.H.T.1A.6]|uniref:hypothetical protein n=1 Tax=unclassified Methanosarcina TaxID=2644672 RepID=UPI00062162DE|nr:MULTISPECIES: hypothetical protein [unclassified Methanosarcina]KKG15934.1 hypothetical protein EO94_10965 [Methanosarcina sp. 2.H.T.1A.3]KKG18819.1 hypothetical protein EO97_19165 [Methanosarcina sp. 2.H.T.1A.15]KKG21073.1 hypothetical protein EO98_01515 [Methanosarcina sp. 2.H.T.1A.6]KKG23819.1 hypothetical protein EO96_07225 [Methanosarcina sp. 2.H.T.1A.8]
MSSDNNDLVANETVTANEMALKKQGLIVFFLVMSVISIGGTLAIYYIPDESGDLGIIKLGFILLEILVLSLLTFVTVNYLSHPTCWSEKMVCRGRTLEYLTVILIVGIVLVLALMPDEVLSSETVGAILAAIAGYVLGRSTRPKEGSEEFVPKSGNQ